MKNKTTQPGLGLINRTYETDATFDPEGEKTQWERFIHFIEHENQSGQGKYTYKIVVAIRHGQGHHNVKEAEVGRDSWNVSRCVPLHCCKGSDFYVHLVSLVTP